MYNPFWYSNESGGGGERRGCYHQRWSHSFLIVRLLTPRRTVLPSGTWSGGHDGAQVAHWTMMWYCPRSCPGLPFQFVCLIVHPNTSKLLRFLLINGFLHWEPMSRAPWRQFSFHINKWALASLHSRAKMSKNSTASQRTACLSQWTTPKHDVSRDEKRIMQLSIPRLCSSLLWHILPSSPWRRCHWHIVARGQATMKEKHHYQVKRQNLGPAAQELQEEAPQFLPSFCLMKLRPRQRRGNTSTFVYVTRYHLQTLSRTISTQIKVNIITHLPSGKHAYLLPLKHVSSMPMQVYSMQV